jgi:hypothetical protein
MRLLSGAGKMLDLEENRREGRALTLQLILKTRKMAVIFLSN